jgi:tRNA threonylcarbamoyladenosine biosynthesis protein TsaB
MTILAIEGALGAFRTAIVRSDGTTILESVPAQRALEDGLRAISSALQRAEIEPDELDRIAVGIGPGAFTGVRIAISYAKALAWGWKVPLVGVSSYDLLDAEIPPPVAAVIVGRPGVICTRVRTEDGERRACGPVENVVATLEDALRVPHLAIVGADEATLAALHERAIPAHVVSARYGDPVLALAILARRRDPAASPHAVEADYGEMPAVKEPVRR